MRWLLAIVALMAAVPAQAQDSRFPTWLVGNWCFQPEAGTVACIEFEPPADGRMLSNQRIYRDGVQVQRTDGVSTIVNGVMFRHVEATGVGFVEVSRGENMVVMDNIVAANIAKGDANRIIFRREGEELVLTFEAPNRAPVTQRYARTPRDAAD